MRPSKRLTGLVLVAIGTGAWLYTQTPGEIGLLLLSAFGLMLCFADEFATPGPQ